MDALVEKKISGSGGEKTLSVHACDITSLSETVDVMTVSAFYRDYEPVRGTLFGALGDKQIDIRRLSEDPEIDLRNPCNIWLSREVTGGGLPIRRIGCVEMSPYTGNANAWMDKEQQILASIRAYFKMLEIAADMGICVEKVILPVLGGGNQGIAVDLVCIPVLNECMRFLKDCAGARHVMIVTRNQQQAFAYAMALEKSYSYHQENRQMTRRRELLRESAGGKKAFISYSSGDRNIADNLCAKLEARGIQVWYAPRNIHSSDYASAIVKAITQCTHFIVILSKNSLQSNHVLNEIDLAFQELGRGVVFRPLKIDEEKMGPAFLYYLSRQHYMDAHVPPLEERLEEFVESM